MPKTEAPKNPIKEATVVATFKGIDDKAIKDYFESKKISASKVKDGWKFVYTARGAAKNDIKKRLDTLTRHIGSFEITSATTVNKEATKK